MTMTTAPRGRHAPPPEIRQAAQRQRLVKAASTLYGTRTLSSITAEAIAREAGVSKATFYEHFLNRDACMFGLASDLIAQIQRR